MQMNQNFEIEICKKKKTKICDVSVESWKKTICQFVKLYYKYFAKSPIHGSKCQLYLCS